MLTTMQNGFIKKVVIGESRFNKIEEHISISSSSTDKKPLSESKGAN